MSFIVQPLASDDPLASFDYEFDDDAQPTVFSPLSSSKRPLRLDDEEDPSLASPPPRVAKRARVEDEDDDEEDETSPNPIAITSAFKSDNKTDLSAVSGPSKRAKLDEDNDGDDGWTQPTASTSKLDEDQSAVQDRAKHDPRYIYGLPEDIAKRSVSFRFVLLRFGRVARSLTSFAHFLFLRLLPRRPDFLLFWTEKLVSRDGPKAKCQLCT